MSLSPCRRSSWWLLLLLASPALVESLLKDGAYKSSVTDELTGRRVGEEEEPPSFFSSDHQGTAGSGETTAFPSLTPTTAATEPPTAATPAPPQYNLLVITADQLRYDALSFVQHQMPIYNNKLKVRTPNIDRLASQGVYFSDAYCQSSSCAPARATLRSGCTIERTGVQGNSAVKDKNGTINTAKSPMINRKIDAIRTYDQVLQAQGYRVESYGKFHIPRRWFRSSQGNENAIQYDSYSANFAYPYFSGLSLTDSRFKSQVRAWKNGTTAKSSDYSDGQQTCSRSLWPYTPLQLDPRQGLPTASPLKETLHYGDDSVLGIDSLLASESMTTYTGTQGHLAIQRLTQQTDRPWALTVSFEKPHPPYIASKDYAMYYLENQRNILIPPNMDESLIQNEFYAKMQAKNWQAGYKNPQMVQEWTAVYYAMIEEVDEWVGTLLDELDRQGAANHTLVIFTSDHGEFLGAHGLQGKFGFLEEAMRVPLLMRLPGVIAEDTVVKRPVSHLDVFATIMDFLGYSQRDQSDGQSLRPSISGTSYRLYNDDEIAVGEDDTEDGFNKKLGTYPNFMIRHGSWKLMVPKHAKSTTEDMLFHLGSDPFEKKNLLFKPKRVGLATIGKAEHLKCLLLEWLQRNDGTMRYYSSSKYNGFKGRGDIEEIRQRRTWRTVDQWISDTSLEFTAPVFVDDQWRSNAWLYIGRTNPGTLRILNIAVLGSGSQYFQISHTKGRISRNGYMKVRVAFVSDTPIDPASIQAKILIRSNIYNSRAVRIVAWD